METNNNKEYAKEEKETVNIDDKVYTVIVRKSKNVLSKEKLINLIASYGIREMKNDY